jgi:hypothetical protein
MIPRRLRGCSDGCQLRLAIHNRGATGRPEPSARPESSARATEPGAVRLLAFGEASAIRVGAAPTLYQGLARLAAACLSAADKLSIGGQWLFRRVASGWSAKNTRRKVKGFEIADRVFSARNGA